MVATVRVRVPHPAPNMQHQGLLGLVIAILAMLFGISMIGVVSSFFVDLPVKTIVAAYTYAIVSGGGLFTMFWILRKFERQQKDIEQQKLIEVLRKNYSRLLNWPGPR